MKRAIAILVILGMLAAVSVAFAIDFPAFPMSFWGGVTIDSSPAPVGSVVTFAADSMI